MAETYRVAHRGYTGQYKYDAEIKMFSGRVIGILDVITFHGTTHSEAKQEMAYSVDDYLTFCAELGKEPEKAEDE